MRRGAFVLALFSLMLLAGCFGPTTASWGADNGGVEVDFDRASTSITSNLGPTVQSIDNIQAVGCSPGDQEIGTNKSMPVKFTGYLASSQMHGTHGAAETGIDAAVTSSVAIQSMSFKQASEILEGDGARVALEDWTGLIALDNLPNKEDSQWFILGLIPTTEHIQDGMLSLGEWHQAVTLEGYLVTSNTSNSSHYYKNQKVENDCSIASESHQQLFVMVTSINLEGASVSSSGDADDEWVHGDVPILGRTGFVLMFFIVGIGGAVASFTLSKMFVMKGARDTMKTLLGQVGIDNIKKVKQDVKKAKSSGMSSPTTRKEEQRSAAKKDKAAPTKTPKKSALAGFDMDSILSNDDDAAPIPSSSGKSSVVVTPAAQEMEQMTPPSSAAPSSVTSTQPSAWDASKRSSSPPTSVTSTQPEPVAREHFSSVAPTRSSAPEPKQPPKKKAVRKRRAAAKPVEEEATSYEAPPRAEKETFEDDENFSDFSF